MARTIYIYKYTPDTTNMGVMNLFSNPDSLQIVHSSVGTMGTPRPSTTSGDGSRARAVTEMWSCMLPSSVPSGGSNRGSLGGHPWAFPRHRLHRVPGTAEEGLWHPLPGVGFPARGQGVGVLSFSQEGGFPPEVAARLSELVYRMCMPS